MITLKIDNYTTEEMENLYDFILSGAQALRETLACKNSTCGSCRNYRFCSDIDSMGITVRKKLKERGAK